MVLRLDSDYLCISFKNSVVFGHNTLEHAYCNQFQRTKEINVEFRKVALYEVKTHEKMNYELKLLKDAYSL